MSSNRRYDAKRDASEPKIVEALEAAGCIVYRQLPCDLLVRVKSDPPGIMRTIEVKVPKRTGKPKLDQRQLKQMEFIQLTGTRYATTPMEALQALRSEYICPGCHLRQQSGVKTEGGF